MRPPRAPPSDEKVAECVATAFSDAQRTLAAHPRASKLLLSAYRTSPDVFLSSFTFALNRALLVFSRQPSVERLVTFVATFASTTTSTTGNFCSVILVYLLEQANAANQAVRFRAIQVVAAVLHAFPEDVDLADDVWESLEAVVLSRALDRVPRVRAVAAAALCRLQSTADPADDEIAARLLEMIAKDSSAAVRKAALQAVAITDATLPTVVSRTRDVRSDVRRVAFETLAKRVDPNGLHLEERVGLIRAGMKDRDAGVRKACTETLLLEGWLDGACEGNVFELAELLGCNEYEEEVLLVLRGVFSSPRHAALIDVIQIDVNNLVHADILVLRALADSQKGETFMEKFIPSTLAYSEVLLYYAVDDFASRHLLELCKSVDMSDEAGRKGLEHVLRTDFLASHQISEETAVCAVRAMRRSMLDEEATIRLMLEIIRVDVLQDAVYGEQELDTENPQATQPPSDDREWRESRALNLCKEILRISSQGDTSGSVINSLCRSLLEIAILPQLLCINVERRRSAMECLGLFCLLDRSSADARQHLPLFIQACKTDVPEVQEIALQVIVDCMMVFDFSDNIDHANSLSPSCSQAKAEEELQDEPLQESLPVLAEECVNILSENITHADGSVRSLSVQGLSRLLFVRRISPSPTLISRMLIAYYNPATEDDDLLRQCLSVFFPAFAQFSDNRLGLEDAFKQTCEVLSSAPSSSPLSTISVVPVAQFILHLTNPANSTRTESPRNTQAGDRPVSQIHERLAEIVLNEIIDAVEADETGVYREYARVLSSFRLSCNLDNITQIELLFKLAKVGMAESDDKRLLAIVRKFRDRMGELLQNVKTEKEKSSSSNVVAQSEENSNQKAANSAPELLAAVEAIYKPEQ